MRKGGLSQVQVLTSSASDREEETMCLGWSVSIPVGIFIDAIMPPVT